MKLVSMTDFVLNQDHLVQTAQKDHGSAYGAIFKYAEFLKQPLELWMFVPCGRDGLPTEEFVADENMDETNFEEVAKSFSELNIWLTGKHKVLFDGHFSEMHNGEYRVWTKHSWMYFSDDTDTLENVLSHDLTLTPNAIKQLGL